MWTDKMERDLSVCITKLWTREFIQLIQEFPDCTPCLEDLKEALTFCKMNEQFVANVIALLQDRLLQIGRSTMLILTIYIKTIPVMKLIDPSTMMLEEISDAFKQFLSKRPDTIRSIVTIIFQKENKLYEQLDNQRYIAPNQRKLQQPGAQTKPKPGVVPGQ